MNHRSRKSEGWLDREWRAQLGTTIWECPVCSQERLGLKELLVGRLVGTCFVCGIFTDPADESETHRGECPVPATQQFLKEWEGF